MKDIEWDSYETVAAIRRLEKTVPVFRDNYIAHTLIGETNEVFVSFLDSKKVVMAACDLLVRLSYGIDSFYLGREKFYMNFLDEKHHQKSSLKSFSCFNIQAHGALRNLIVTVLQTNKQELLKRKLKR